MAAYKHWAAIVVVCVVFSACTSTKPPAETAQSAPPPPPVCTADSSWVTSPNPPTEIGNGVPVSQETNCQFYQFAYQWFFDMVQPVGTSGERKFETFNIFQPGKNNQCGLPKMTGLANISKALFVRTKKSAKGFDPVLPEDIKQATGQALYDQAGNVVLFSVFYNPQECQANATSGYLPNTIEIKSAWRILGAPDSTYYTITANIQAVSKSPILLGLVGFHLVSNTKNHPEFVWASFEHLSNAPDCTNPQAPPTTAGWSFLSSSCAACLKANGVNGCPQCGFNTGVAPPPGLKGTPNQVCRVYHDGTDPGSMTNGNNNDTNRANIENLNSQISGILSKLSPDSPMAVWKNYTLVGGLWTNGGVGSGVANEQRGSLEAANMTMETFFQQPNQNCFTCHNYDPTQPLQVSHIIDHLLPATALAKPK